MKKSINIWSFSTPDSLKGKFEQARSAGFEGFEIDLSEDGPVTLDSSDEEVLKVKEIAEQVGVTLSGLATGLYWGANPVSADAATADKARKILERQIEVAALLGIDAILVVPGTVGADFIPDGEVVSYDHAYQRATDFIRNAIPLAEKHKVVIGIENVWNKFLLSPLELANFIDQFESEYVGSYLDVGNILATGYPEQWIRILGTRICRVHLKDYRRAVGTVDGFVELLSGDVDWPAVAGALRDVGYSGWVTAEMIPPIPFYKHGPEVLIENTGRAMDRILAMA